MKFPKREAFGWQEYFSLIKCATYYRIKKVDPPYDGVFQKKLELRFVKLFKAKSARLVSSGTSAVYVALKSLELQPGSPVLVSSITDGGCISAIIEAGLKPVLIDTGLQTFNINLKTVVEAFEETKKISGVYPSCCVACHIGGEPISQISEIADWCFSKKITLIEDCSQTIKGKVDSKYAGMFGQLAVFSLMYRKNISSSGSAGIIVVNDDVYSNKVLAYSDRGKPLWKKNLYLNDPGLSLFPALNHNSNEFTAAITLSSLNRINKTIEKRTKFCLNLLGRIHLDCIPLQNVAFNADWSPFYLTLFAKDLSTSKLKAMAEDLLKNSKVPLLINYGCLASKWGWLQPYLAFVRHLPNAEFNINHSFNLFVNEKYRLPHVRYIIRAMKIATKN